jgi:hypothetical protein
MLRRSIPQLTSVNSLPSSVAVQPNWGPLRLTVEVSRSHTIRQTLPVGILLTSENPFEEAATYTTHNKPNTRTAMPPARFEPTIPAIVRP